MFTSKANSKRKCVKRHENMKRYTTIVWLASQASPTRRGDLAYSRGWADGEQTLLSATIYSLWRTDYSRWRVVTGFCREVRFFTPKTPISSTPIPKLIGNSTYDDSTTCTSITHIINGLSTYSTINLIQKPNSSNH